MQDTVSLRNWTTVKDIYFPLRKIQFILGILKNRLSQFVTKNKLICCHLWNNEHVIISDTK
jgi:hypothetical protein